MTSLSLEGNLGNSQKRWIDSYLAPPDADTISFDGGLATEGANVLRPLLGQELLNDFPQRGTVSAAVFSGDSYLLSSFSHCNIFPNLIRLYRKLAPLNLRPLYI